MVLDVSIVVSLMMNGICCVYQSKQEEDLRKAIRKDVRTECKRREHLERKELLQLYEQQKQIIHHYQNLTCNHNKIHHQEMQQQQQQQLPSTLQQQKKMLLLKKHHLRQQKKYEKSANRISNLNCVDELESSFSYYCHNVCQSCDDIRQSHQSETYY